MKKTTIQFPPPTFQDWEDELTTAIANKLELSRSDAQGYIEVNEFYISQAWGKSMDPDAAANYIIDKNKQSMKDHFSFEENSK